MRCFYSESLEQEIFKNSDFSNEKLRLSRERLLQQGILKAEEIIEVKATDFHHILRVHDRSYIEKVQSNLLDRKEQILLGLPASSNLFSRSAHEVEATRKACEAALEEGVGVCLAGGTHHAFRSHGEDFCVFNDIAVAIRFLQDKQPQIKIMVIDTDAHQGHGTASILAGDPRVFTYSIHVKPHAIMKRFPSSMDVETVRYVEGEMYLRLLFESLADALDAFVPDLVIWISGADNHRNDRAGRMYLTYEEIQHRDEILLQAMIRNRIPIAILYGGGNNQQSDVTARLHSSTIATAKRLAAEYRGL